MARHAHATERRTLGIRLGIVALVWLAGLVAGFSALLAAAAKYGCASTQHGLGCQTSGSVLGILLVLAVLVIVSTVTLVVPERPAQRVLAIGVTGIVGLAACYAGARVLLATT